MVFDTKRCSGVLNGVLKLRDVSGYWMRLIVKGVNCSVVMWEGFQVVNLCGHSFLMDLFWIFSEHSTLVLESGEIMYFVLPPRGFYSISDGKFCDADWYSWADGLCQHI